MTRILSDINVQVHMKPFRTLRILSHTKDHIPDDDKSSIVYKVNCHDCDASYVGEMGRALKTCVSKHHRAMEKRDFSASALVQHAWEHDHHIDWTSTCVLGVSLPVKNIQRGNLHSQAALFPQLGQGYPV